MDDEGCIMTIKHILKNGKALQDITGHKVTKKDAPMTYRVIEQLNKERTKKNEYHL